MIFCNNNDFPFFFFDSLLLQVMESQSMIYIVSEYASQGEIFGEFFMLFTLLVCYGWCHSFCFMTILSYCSISFVSRS